jgi:hypothetical protein
VSAEGAVLKDARVVASLLRMVVEGVAACLLVSSCRAGGSEDDEGVRCLAITKVSFIALLEGDLTYI